MVKIENNGEINSDIYPSFSNGKLITTDEVNGLAENIINTIRKPLIVSDKDVRVTKASCWFYNFFEVERAEIIGKLIYDWGNRQWEITKPKELPEIISLGK